MFNVTIKNLEDTSNISTKAYDVLTELDILSLKRVRGKINPPKGVKVHKHHRYSRMRAAWDCVERLKRTNISRYNEMVEETGSDEGIYFYYKNLIDNDWGDGFGPRLYDVNKAFNIVILWEGTDEATGEVYDEHWKYHAATYGCAIFKDGIPVNGINKYKELSGVEDVTLEEKVDVEPDDSYNRDGLWVVTTNGKPFCYFRKNGNKYTFISGSRINIPESMETCHNRYLVKDMPIEETGEFYGRPKNKPIGVFTEDFTLEDCSIWDLMYLVTGNVSNKYDIDGRVRHTETQEHWNIAKKGK